MTLNEAQNRYINYLVSKGRHSKTIKHHNDILNKFILFVSPIDTVQEIRQNHVYEYHLSLLPKDYANSTLRHHLTAIKAFFEYLIKSKILLISPAVNLPTIKGKKALPRAILSEAEIRHIFSLPDTTTKTGIRNRAIMELFYSSGIRRKELCALDLYDIDLEKQEVKVSGKLGKERVVPFGNEAKKWLIRYLKEVREKQKSHSPALFLTLNKGVHRLDYYTTGSMIGQYSDQSGLKKRWTTHSLRHTCATHLLAHGANIRYIQEFLGHNKLHSTQIYTHVEIKTLEEVFKKTHPRAKESKENLKI
jgi:integrase/recombinase XerD